MKQVLLTGSNGFIGRKLKEKLIEMNYQVIEINSENGGVTNLKVLEGINYDNIVHVFHLAAKTFVPESWINPEEYYKINTMGTLNILGVCRKNKIKLTFISSYIYGEPEVLPISEMHTLNPSSPYAHSKYLAEECCEFYAKQFDTDIVVIRPFNIYGIGQSEHFLIPHIINQAINEKEIRVKDLTPRRDYIYLEDLIEVLILTLNIKKGYSVFNVGSGCSYCVKEIIDIVQKVLNTNKVVLSDDIIRTNEISDVVADITRVKESFDWHPKYSFVEGIQAILDGLK